MVLQHVHNIMCYCITVYCIILSCTILYSIMSFYGKSMKSGKNLSQADSMKYSNV